VEEALRRGLENLIGRLGGPMSFRLILQPSVAIVFAIRAGLRDARNNQPPFLWTVFSNPDHRRELLHQGWKDVGTVFVVAVILDSIYQVIVHSGIYALELLSVATMLALVPYALVRGLVTRLARRRLAVTPAGGRAENNGKRSEDKQQEREEH
jgi:hypothetical protein